MTEPTKARILFLCTGNSCRSQMAEGFTRHLAAPGIVVDSAGLEAHGQNPRAITAMAELGIDITGQASTRVNDAMIWAANMVVTVCGHADEHCPVLLPNTVKRHWAIPDPARAAGSEAEIMDTFRAVRDDIHTQVIHLLDEYDWRDTK